jgi:hypothetical protein
MFAVTRAGMSCHLASGKKRERDEFEKEATIIVLRSFGQLSRSYSASEKSWEFVIEALGFSIIAAISAWPVFAAADELNQFLQSTAS